jgi:hypothetical protein
MRTPAVILCLAVLPLCAPTALTGQAEAAWLDVRCSLDAFEVIGTDSLKAAEITGAASSRLHFQHDEIFGDDDYQCPRANDPRCTEKSYVLPGDRVLVSLARAYSTWLCARHQPPGPAQGEAVGWLPIARLRVLETTTALPVERWLGTWWYYDSSLEISLRWRDRQDRLRTFTVDARVPAGGRKVEVRKGRCRLTLSLIEPFIVADESECGPRDHEAFQGIYQRDR